MKETVIVSAVRTAVGKAPRGILKDTRPDDISAIVIKEAVSRVPGLKIADQCKMVSDQFSMFNEI